MSLVIGALRVNLGLDSAKFSRGIKGANASLAKMRKQFLAVSLAAAAFAAAIGKTALSAAKRIDEATKAARRLDASLGAFKALEIAAGDAGVALTSMTDDIQSMNREIANIGTSGNALRALKRLGLSVEDLADIDADEKMARIADAVKNLGLDAGETTALLRDMGVRNRAMVLLLLQGGDAIRRARRDIEKYGLALDEVQTDRIEKANDQISRLSVVWQYFGQQLALKIVPALGALAEVMTESLKVGGGLRNSIDVLIAVVQRIIPYLGSLVVILGTRYVAAMGLALAATIRLHGAIKTLGLLLLRFWPIALAALVGELIIQFIGLVQKTGSVGAAFGVLRDVAAEVFGERIPLALEALDFAFLSLAETVRAAFLDATAAALRFIDDGLGPIKDTLAGLNADLKSLLSGGRAGTGDDVRKQVEDYFIEEFAPGGAGGTRGVGGGTVNFSDTGDGGTSLLRSSGRSREVVSALEEWATTAAAGAAVAREKAAEYSQKAGDAWKGATAPLESLAALETAVEDVGNETEITTEKAVEGSEQTVAAADRSTAAVGRTTAALEDLGKENEEIKETVPATFALIRDSANSAFKDVISGAKNAGEAILNFFDRILSGIAEKIFSERIADPFSSALGKIVDSVFGFTANANGNAYQGGRVMAFANGGIVNGPTLFPMANGAGLMGEAGPEAVMPLRRDSRGRLGVSADGGGANVVVNIATEPGLEATATETTRNGARELQIQVVRAVAADIASGGTTYRAMRQTFGLNPQLAGRS